ncbi:MAG: glycosyltransferase family 2 protein [Clostridiales bacterium]|nr:glycosyltransferase family 2 protein [Clostridiales bacterium]
MRDKVQVLVATMNQRDHSLIEKMNLQTDALIGNQCNKCSDEKFNLNGKEYIYYNRNEKGVGLNRNTTLLRAGNGIVTFADDDMVFVDGYEAIIQKAFQELPTADVIIFNLKTKGFDVGRRQNKKTKRIRFYNALNYGAARISARAVALRRENITFHTCFGGGTNYSCGEDTLFIVDMLKAGLKIYAYPVCIAEVDQTSSSWFQGYNEKYLHDKGALFRAISRKWAVLLYVQDLIRHPYLLRETKLNYNKALRLMIKGGHNFLDLKKYRD